MITVIAARELRSLFVSPLAWVVLAVVQLVLGWLFVIYVWNFEALSARLSALPSAPGISAMVVAPLLKTASIVLLLVSPLLTMRLVSGERRNATLNLLMSSPLSMTELVLGKYLGMMAFFALLLALVALLPLSLLTVAALDLGLVASGLLGLLLLCSSFAAAGLYMSTLTRTPAVAAVCTFGLLLALWSHRRDRRTRRNQSHWAGRRLSVPGGASRRFVTWSLRLARPGLLRVVHRDISRPVDPPSRQPAKASLDVRKP